MTENPLVFTGGARLSASKLRSSSDVVFVDVGARKIESRVVRDGVPIGVHQIDPDVLRDVVIGEPIIGYRIVDQTVPPGTPVPLDTAIDVVMARPGPLPVGIVTGVHADLRQFTIDDAFNRLVAGKPQAQRIVARAAEGPLSADDEQVVRDLFQAADFSIEETPGRDVAAGLETLRVLTTFGGD